MGRAARAAKAPKKISIAGYLMPEDEAELSSAAERFGVSKQLIISEGVRLYLRKLQVTGRLEVHPGPISELPLNPSGEGEKGPA